MKPSKTIWKPLETRRKIWQDKTVDLKRCDRDRGRERQTNPCIELRHQYSEVQTCRSPSSWKKFAAAISSRISADIAIQDSTFIVVFSTGSLDRQFLCAPLVQILHHRVEYLVPDVVNLSSRDIYYSLM